MIYDLRHFEYGDYRLAYEVHGAGPQTVVLLHGLLLDAHVNRDLGCALADAGFRVVLLDLLGHGRSDRPHDPTLHRFDLYAKQVVALLDHLEVRQAVIGGLSLGADVSLHVAALAPNRVRAIYRAAQRPIMQSVSARLRSWGFRYRFTCRHILARVASLRLRWLA